MSTYWPWWAGPSGSPLVTINYTLTTDKSFGVSSAWDRVLHWRAERRIERLEAEFTDERALVDALAAATAEHFGPPRRARPAAPPTRTHRRPSARHRRESAGTSRRSTPLVAQAALLISIFVGGWIAAVTSGRFKLRCDMGDGFPPDRDRRSGHHVRRAVRRRHARRLRHPARRRVQLRPRPQRLRPAAARSASSRPPCSSVRPSLVSFLLWKVI